jgi:hypothetical protein
MTEYSFAFVLAADGGDQSLQQTVGMTSTAALAESFSSLQGGVAVSFEGQNRIVSISHASGTSSEPRVPDPISEYTASCASQEWCAQMPSDWNPSQKCWLEVEYILQPMATTNKLKAKVLCIDTGTTNSVVELFLPIDLFNDIAFTSSTHGQRADLAKMGIMAATGGCDLTLSDITYESIGPSLSHMRLDIPSGTIDLASSTRTQVVVSMRDNCDNVVLYASHVCDTSISGGMAKELGRCGPSDGFPKVHTQCQNVERCETTSPAFFPDPGSADSPAQCTASAHERYIRYCWCKVACPVGYTRSTDTTHEGLRV